eukprot:403335861
MVTFNLYGMILRSVSPLNFIMDNSTMITDWMNEGIILQYDCSVLQNNTFKGDIYINNIVVKGGRKLTVSLPHILIVSLNNITIQNSTFRSYSSADDGNQQQLAVDTPNVCSFPADDLNKTMIFRNIYITSDAQISDPGIQYSYTCTQKSDVYKRQNACIFENIFAENVKSFISFLILNSGNQNQIITNLTQKNVSVGPFQSYQLELIGGFSNTLYVKDLAFINCHTESRSIILVLLHKDLQFENWTMINNSLSMNKNTLCFFKSASIPLTGSQVFNNLYFSGNKNTTFYGFAYSDKMKIDSQIIRFDELSEVSNPIENSTFKNVTMQNCQAGDTKKTNLPLQVNINNCNVTNNFPMTLSFIKLNTNSRLVIRDSVFHKILSQSRGSVILADFQNVDVQIFNSNFTSSFAKEGGLFYVHYGGSLLIDSSVMSDNFAYSGGIATVENQGRITVKNSIIQNNIATRVPVVKILDSYDQTSKFQNCTFINNQIMNVSSIVSMVFTTWKITPQMYNKLSKMSQWLENAIKLKDDFKYQISISKAQLLFSNCKALNTQNFLIAYIANFTIEDSKFDNITFQMTDESFLSGLQSQMQIQNSTFTNFNYPSRNSIAQIPFGQNSSGLNFSGQIPLVQITLGQDPISLQAIQAKQSNLILLRSNFTNCENRESGGAIFISNSNYSSTSSIFTNNRAKQGGAIRFECSKSKLCQQNMTEDVYIGNIALIEGGAFSYNKYRPIMVGVIFSQDNYAPYGSNFSGYPYGIKLISQDKDLVASGQQYTGEIIVALVDADQNIITNDNTSSISISSVNNKAKVSGQTQIKVSNGIGIFKDVYFEASPGTYLKKKDSLELLNIGNHFRQCIAGEIVQNEECFICGVGFYSLLPASTDCYECPAHSDCQGKDQISVNKGYWRSSYYSTNIIECLNEKACIGGQITTNSSSIQLCDFGYGGNLCHSCIAYDDLQFTRIGKHECGLCPSKAINLLYIMGIFLALVIALILLLWVNLKSTQESETSIIIRILLNYFHILTSASSFNLNWPVYFQEFLGIYSAVGETAESFISFDCFLQDTGFTEPGSSTYYFKVLVIVILPVVLGIIFVMFFFLKKLFLKTSFLQFQRQIIVSCVVLLFAIHPTITRVTSSLFFCMELDKKEYWLYTDLEIKCWEGSHLKWSLGIGIPGIILWVVGIPIVSFLYLKRNQQRLDDPIFFEKYKMIYQGLKRKYFYWEYANILRKVFLISVNVFLNLYPNIFKALLSLLTLSIFLRIQSNIQPYKNPVINQLESREIMTSLITFFGALYFVNYEISDTIQLLVFIIIVLVNCWFLALCGYCMLSTINLKFAKIISKLLRKIIMSNSLIAQEQHFKIRKSIENNDDATNNDQKAIISEQKVQSINQLEFDTNQLSQKTPIKQNLCEVKVKKHKSRFSKKKTDSEIRSIGLKFKIKPQNKKPQQDDQNLEDLFQKGKGNYKHQYQDQVQFVQMIKTPNQKKIMKQEGGFTNQSSRFYLEYEKQLALFNEFEIQKFSSSQKQEGVKKRRFKNIMPLSISAFNYRASINDQNHVAQTPPSKQKNRNVEIVIDPSSLNRAKSIEQKPYKELQEQFVGQDNQRNKQIILHMPYVETISNNATSERQKTKNTQRNISTKVYYKEDHLNIIGCKSFNLKQQNLISETTDNQSKVANSFQMKNPIKYPKLQSQSTRR